VFALPGKTAGKPAPPFVGGSDLAVPVGSDAPDLAEQLIAMVAGRGRPRERRRGAGLLGVALPPLD
jgi:N,N'-diacetylchitobiose transport system substrate-binding protein